VEHWKWHKALCTGKAKPAAAAAATGEEAATQLNSHHFHWEFQEPHRLESVKRAGDASTLDTHMLHVLLSMLQGGQLCRLCTVYTFAWIAEIQRS
jgi:hypothetical protein